MRNSLKTNLQTKVHFVGGKGGVGKTLISQALATLFASVHKTLLVELCEEESGEGRLKTTIKETKTHNLYYVKMFPDQALYEYLSLKISQKKLLDSVVSQKLFKALSSAMPGLADLTRLGKIWYHADEQHGKKDEIYEKIVVDMPSSGFILRFLTIAHVVQMAVKIGPLAHEARLIHQYFSSHALLHLVTLAEELVINETIELYRQVRQSPNVHLGAVFINRLLKFSKEELHPLHKENYPYLSSLMALFQSRAKTERIGRTRLTKVVNLPQILISDQIGEMIESKIMTKIIEELPRGFMS
jgi:anion-transporting  ArsA/GET3 family ATPase